MIFACVLPGCDVLCVHENIVIERARGCAVVPAVDSAGARVRQSPCCYDEPAHGCANVLVAARAGARERVFEIKQHNV